MTSVPAPAESKESGRHRRTDPACHYHQEPTGRLSRWLYDLARGRSCDLCMRIRALAALPFWRRNNWRTWWDDPTLDPEPWRLYDKRGLDDYKERYAHKGYGTTFDPRPGYSQNREDYA